MNEQKFTDKGEDNNMMKNKTNVKWKKRAATIVMSLCLLMGLMPITVFAAGSSKELPVYTIESEEDGDYVERDVKATFTSSTDFTLGAFHDAFGNKYGVQLDYYNPNRNPNLYGTPDEGFDKLVECNIFLQFTDPTDDTISGKITIPLPSGYDGTTARIQGGATAISYNETTVTFPVTLVVSGGSTFTQLYVEYKEKSQPPASTPSITRGQNEKWTQGSANELIFTSNAPLSEFISVTIDGQVVDEKNYVKEEGSTIIKLKADYLSTLSAGNHTISINSTSGSATTAFTIEEAATTSSGATTAVSPDAKSPKTGDNNNLFLWATMLCISGFAIFGTRIYSKKEKNIK